MSSAASQFDDLLRRLAAAFDIYRASSLLSWDEETKMPPEGATARAEAQGTLARIAHELSTAPELGELLSSAEIAALRRRAQRLCEEGSFPNPRYKHVPYRW